MVKLRLKRIGRKGKPFYRIVAMHSTLAKKGAQMSETVRDLLKSQGILARFRGLEGTVRENSLSREKPKRKKKLTEAKTDSSETDATIDSIPDAPDGELAEAATAEGNKIADSDSEA